MIEIDGTFGEGGGQILRTSLALSALTGKAFHIARIRGRRPKPGLHRQHLTGVLAAQRVADAQARAVQSGATPERIGGLQKELARRKSLDLPTGDIILLLAKDKAALQQIKIAQDDVRNTAGSFLDSAGGFNLTGDLLGQAFKDITDTITGAFVAGAVNVTALTSFATTKLGEAARGFDLLGNALDAFGNPIKKAKNTASEVAAAQLEYELAMAELTGNTRGAEAAIQKQIAADQAELDALNASLDAASPLLGALGG